MLNVLARCALARSARTLIVGLLIINVLTVLHHAIKHTGLQSLQYETLTPFSHTTHSRATGSRNAIAIGRRKPVTISHLQKWKVGNSTPVQRMVALAQRKPVKRPSTPWPTMAPDPKSPLTAERQSIVRKSPAVNLVYEPPGNTSRHPHLGAPAENVTALRSEYNLLWDSKNTAQEILQQLNLTEDDCTRTDSDAVALQRIHIATPDMIRNASKSTLDLNGTVIPADFERPPIRLLCAIYSSEPHHSRLEAVRQTWGPKCDGFFVASNVTDPAVNAVRIPHAGNETYDNMWQKVRSIWSYIYQNHYEDFDYVHLAGDDSWVIVENLRYYLNGAEVAIAANGGMDVPSVNLSLDSNETSTHNLNQTQVPLYLGSRLALEKNHSHTFNTGGPGYTLNRAAIKLLVTKGLDNYFSNETTSAEDVRIALTLLELGVHPYPTRELDTQSERYHHLTPGLHRYSGSIKRPHAWVDWWSRPFHAKLGKNHSSVYSAAFHYMYPHDMRRYHAHVYGYCRTAYPNTTFDTSIEEGRSAKPAVEPFMPGPKHAALRAAFKKGQPLNHSAKVVDAFAQYLIGMEKQKQARQSLLLKKRKAGGYFPGRSQYEAVQRLRAGRSLYQQRKVVLH